jgi:hypothetical protein
MLRPLLSQPVLSPCYSRLVLKKLQLGRIFPREVLKNGPKLRVCPPCVGIDTTVPRLCRIRGRTEPLAHATGALPQPPHLIGRRGLGIMPGSRATRKLRFHVFRRTPTTLSRSRLRGDLRRSPRSPFLDNFWMADNPGMIWWLLESNAEYSRFYDLRVDQALEADLAVACSRGKFVVSGQHKRYYVRTGRPNPHCG